MYKNQRGLLGDGNGQKNTFAWIQGENECVIVAKSGAVTEEVGRASYPSMAELICRQLNRDRKITPQEVQLALNNSIDIQKGKPVRVLGVKPYSHHYEDWFLSVILCQYGTEYVTWIFNEQTGGAGTGHYFNADNYEAAVKDFMERGVPNNEVKECQIG
jgi:hypothetical protein